MDSKNFAIGVLSTTAVILLVGVLIIHGNSKPAFASGMTASGGKYILTVGSVSINDEELVFVIDTGAKKMLAYRFDTGGGQIQIVSGVNLADLPAAGGGSKSKSRRP